jgi:hypothetical protein
LIRILRATHAREFEEAVTLMVCSHEGNRLKNLPALIDFSKKYPVNKFNMIRQIYAAARVRFPGRLKRPVFLLASDGDRLVSRDCTLALAAHWGAPASFHPWAGHDLPIDDPLWILNEIEKSS